MDVPDRLPFEVAERFWAGVPVLDEDHAVQPVHLVLATKPGQSTGRPFVRVHPRDLLLYQALVDALRDTIEDSLGRRDEVFAYRMSTIDEDDPLAESPRWNAFAGAVRGYAEASARPYLVQADVSSFFISIRIPELERRLLEAGGDGEVIRDLTGLLYGWSSGGVQGLPQGIMPSSPLANFYLSPLDALLRVEGVPFWRYMDDLWIAADTHHDGRRLLDLVEAILYDDGLSLGAGKTKVMRAASAAAALRPTQEVLDEELSELLAAADPYFPSDDEADEWRLDRVKELFDAAVEALDQDEYRRTELTFALRQFGHYSDGHALQSIPYVLLRMPGMTQVACNYMAKVANPTTREELVAALETLVIEREFHRPQEWMHLLRAVMTSGDRVAPSLLPRLTELCEGHQHPLVRARALLAWGRQSETDDFSQADAFFARERRPQLGYALVAIQGKAPDDRNERYDRWSSEGRPLSRLAQSLRGSPLAWSSI